MYVVDIEPADGRALRRRVHDRRRRLGARGDPGRLRRPARARRSWRSATRRPASDTPTLADVGGDVSKISTDPDPVPAFYETSIADAVAAEKPFVVAFATPKFCVTQQCGPTLDRLKPIAADHPDVTVINVEPYQLEFTDGAAAARPDRRPASAHAGPGRAGVGPADRAVGVRGRPRRHRDRLVHADLQRRGARGGAHRRRVTAGRTRSASARPRAGSPGDRRPSIRYQTRTGSAVAWCSARWPGGNSVPFSRSRRLNSTSSPPGRRSVNPATSAETCAVDGDDHAGHVGRARRDVRVDAAGLAQEDRRQRGHDDDPANSTAKSRRVRRSTRSGAGGGRAGRAPVLPGCIQRVARPRSAGRSPRLARRSAGRAARASAAGRSRPVVGEVSVARPPLRSTSTAHSTISPPSASTAGIIASSEPPVVRMSSTSRTRSPGWIVNPRRNSRRVARRRRATSSAKIARRSPAGEPSRTRG